MKKLLSLTLLLALLLGLLLVPTRVAAEDERVLRMDYSSDMGFPSMYTSKANGPGFVSVTFCFDTLVWKDKDGEMNLLCKDYEISDDGLTYTFHLREGVTFHDGQPFTAEDVKFTFDYTVDHPYQWTSTTMVKEVRAVDELTVEVELNKVYVPFITDVAGNLHILPKHIFEKVEDPSTFTEKEAAIGTGPFMLENYDPESKSFVFVKNPHFYLGEVQIDKLILSPFEDARAALLAGDIDATGSMNFKKAQTIQNEENMSYLQGQSIQVKRLNFSFDHPALAQKEIRQAISFAIDREAIVEKAMLGGAIPGTAGFVHPDSEWYNDQVKTYPYDVPQAKALLADAGAADEDGDGILEYKGEKMSYEFLFSENDVKVGEMIVAYLKEVGIELLPKTADDGTIKGSFAEGKFDVIFNGHGTFGGDPKYLACFATDTAGAIKVSIAGGHRWQNDDFDKLFADSLSETDSEKRHDLIDELQLMIAEELPTLSIYFPITAAVYNNTVFEGFYFTPDGIGAGCPFTYNKMIFITGTWNQ